MAALLFSFVLIVGAYVIARGLDAPQVAQASTETSLLAAIASKDSDNDGLPDWEESLYGTDPHNPDTFHLGMTDGEAVARGLIVPKVMTETTSASSTPAVSGSDYANYGLPTPSQGTITDAFAKNFFALYLSAKNTNGGAELTTDQTSALANQALTQISQQLTPTADYKKQGDLNVSGTGPDALRAYAVAAEAIMMRNATSTTMGEIQYLQAAVENGDTSAIERLRAISQTYRNVAIGLAALPVPKELAPGALLLVNSMMRVSGIVADFSRIDVDPIGTMLALQQYLPAARNFAQAFTTIASVYAAEQVTLPDGTPGAAFVNVMANTAARTPAQTNQ